MKNRIWNEVLCLLGLTATGAMAQDYLVTDNFRTHGSGDGFQRQTWTSGTYGHVDSLTSSQQTFSEPKALATEKYRYEHVPGSTKDYQYTWNSSFDANSVQLPANVQAPATQSTVKYQWPDGSVSEEAISSTMITDGGSLSSTTMQSGANTTTFGTSTTTTETQYRWAGGEPVVAEQPVATVTPAAPRRAPAYDNYRPMRRTRIQRTEWDAFSSRLSLKARFTFNVNTDFRSTNPNNTGAAAGAGDRFYDNGFVRNDANPADGTTGFYGYDGAAQSVGPVNAAAQFDLFFHSVSSPADGQVRGDDSILPGVEVNYEEIFGSRRVLGELPWGFGLIAGVSFAHVDHRNAEALTGTAAVLQDRYRTVAGPPLPPGFVSTFNSTANGGVPVLTDGPDRVTPGGFASPATGSLVNELNGQLYAFEVGPLLEIPITESISAVVAGGFGMVLADLEFAFNEAFALTTIMNGSPAAIARSGSDSDLTVLMGGFARLNLRYQFDDRWAAEVGLQYQNLGDTDRRVGGKTATLNLDHMLSVNGGVSYAF